MQNHFLLKQLREWGHFEASCCPVLNVQQKLFFLSKHRTFKLLTRKPKLYFDFFLLTSVSLGAQIGSHAEAGGKTPSLH